MLCLQPQIGICCTCLYPSPDGSVVICSASSVLGQRVIAPLCRLPTMSTLGCVVVFRCASAPVFACRFVGASAVVRVRSCGRVLARLCDGVGALAQEQLLRSVGTGLAVVWVQSSSLQALTRACRYVSWPLQPHPFSCDVFVVMCAPSASALIVVGPIASRCR